MRHDLPCATEEGTIARVVDPTEETDAWEKGHAPSLVLQVWVGVDGRTLNKASWSPDVTAAIRSMRSGEVDVEAANAALDEMGMAALAAVLVADALLKAALKGSNELPVKDEAAARA